jgi:hypothetical protein
MMKNESGQPKAISRKVVVEVEVEIQESEASVVSIRDHGLDRDRNIKKVKIEKEVIENEIKKFDTG